MRIATWHGGGRIVGGLAGRRIAFSASPPKAFPTSGLQGTAARALLRTHAAKLAPRWLKAEGFASGGSADAHALVTQSVADKCAEWGQALLVLKVDLSDAFRSITCGNLMRALSARIGGQGARACSSHHEPLLVPVIRWA